MPFFQNPFAKEFQGYWLLGDRHHSPTFKVAANPGRGSKHVISWNKGPYDLSGNDADGNSADTLVLRFALRGEPIWATLSVDITSGAADASAVTSVEIASALNSDDAFASRLICQHTPHDKLLNIVSKEDETKISFYVVNGRAEEKLGFNARASIAELPSYFNKHTVDAMIAGNTASEGMLIELDTANTVDANLIDAAVDAHGKTLGYDSGSVQEDWQLLSGRSGLFQFKKGPSTNAVSSTETEIIYPAGAKVGDLSTKILTKKDSGGDVVERFEIPHVLTNADMITP